MSSQDAATDSSAVTRHIGRVKWFNNQKGYGFLTFQTDSGEWEDVFVHHSAVSGDDTDAFRYLVQDEYIEFDRIVSSDALATASDVTGPLRNKLAYQLRNERRAELQEKDEAEGKEPRNKSRYRGGGPRHSKVKVEGTEWKLPKGKSSRSNDSASKKEAENEQDE